MLRVSRTLAERVASALLVAACQDLQTVTDPAPPTSAAVGSGPQAARAQFNRSVPDVLALPGTVFGDLDESTGQLVFGVENEGVTRGVQNVLSRLGVPTSSYSIRVVEPVRFASSLQGERDPKVGGLQIHFSNFLCTLGFSAEHVTSGEFSFVTASHCSDNQGKTDGTAYFQPTSSVDPTPIAFEVFDPPYLKGLDDCSRGKKCRYSDATRALYENGVEFAGDIGKTSGANNTSLEIVGTFDVTGKGGVTVNDEVNKVGSTTGWTQGIVTGSCVHTNVFGSNIQLLCQTWVSSGGPTIIGSGDSGSPAFTENEDGSADLAGIVWGSSGNSTFIFSPMSGVERELGVLNVTADGVGTGSGTPPPPDEDEPNCPPKSNSPKCR